MDGIWGVGWDRLSQTAIVVFAGAYAGLWWWGTVPRPKFLTLETGADLIEGLAMAPVAVLVTSPLFPMIGNYLVAHDSPILAGAGFMSIVALIERGARRQRGGDLGPESTGNDKAALRWGARIIGAVLFAILIFLITALIKASAVEERQNSGAQDKSAAYSSPSSATSAAASAEAPKS